MNATGGKLDPLSIKLDKEVRNVKDQILKVSNELANSQLELGVAVRLNVELRELEAYLRGILFAVVEAPHWETN